MLASDCGLVNFVQKVTEICRRQSLLHQLLHLGQHLLMDYIQKKVSKSTERRDSAKWVGQPDPMMGFASGTTFTPYAVVRNTTAGRVTLTPALNYMVGPGPVTRTLPPLQLDSWEARQLDLGAMMKSIGLAGFSGNVNLSLSYLGQPRDLVVATGSVDQTGTYVFAVEPQEIGPSSSKEDSYWTVADGWDTMINLWNPEVKAQDFTVTFYYADGSGQYVLPVHLEGEASSMIDMMQLISAQQPDPQRNLIPPMMQFGSAVLSSAQGVTERMTLAVSAATFNVATATCCTNKVYCYGKSDGDSEWFLCGGKHHAVHRAGRLQQR